MKPITSPFVEDTLSETNSSSLKIAWKMMTFFWVPAYFSGDELFLAGGFKYVFYFDPEPWGKISILTIIFFKWVGSTTSQVSFQGV